MKIGILTLYDAAFEDIAKRTLPNKRWYAARQRYPLIVERRLFDPSRNASWNKILALKQHLPEFHWLFWMDIDSLITNSDVRLESLIDLTKDIVFPTDSGQEGGFPGYAPGSPRINASHVLIRNCRWSHMFLDAVYGQEQFVDHRWWEQKAMMHVLESRPDWQHKVRTLPDRVLKSNPANYQPGDFLVHFGGRDKRARIDGFLASHPVPTCREDSRACLQSAIRSELADSYYVYRRVGQSAYPIRLRGDGTLDGARRDERKWTLQWRGAHPVVTLHSEAAAICELSGGDDGSWTGHQPGDPRAPVELVRHRGQTLVDKLRRKPRPIRGAEIGVYAGDTSAILLESLPELTLLMIDAWQAARPGDRWWKTGDPYARIGQQELDERMATAVGRTRFAADRRIVLVAEHAAAAAVVPDGLGLVFLDAEHSYQGTLEAIRVWWPKLAGDGLMAGHDYGHPDYPDVERAVHEFAAQHDLMLHAAPDYVWYLERPT